MKSNPERYVSKRYNIPEARLKTVEVKKTKKYDLRGPSWSHTSWDEVVYAVVEDKETRKRYEVYDAYVDMAANIYTVKVEEK